MNTTPIIEAGKEMLRVIVLAVLPIILTGLNQTTGQINIDWKVIAVVALVAGLKFLDKWLHEKGVELKDRGNWDNSLLKGLTRF